MSGGRPPAPCTLACPKCGAWVLAYLQERDGERIEQLCPGCSRTKRRPSRGALWVAGTVGLACGWVVGYLAVRWLGGV